MPADQGPWTVGGNRLAVRFACKWHDDAGSWFCSYGNGNGEFARAGRMRRRLAINDLPIAGAGRKFHWPAPGPRPAGHPGLGDLGF